VIGSHRRARDLATAMVSRGSTSAPDPDRPPFRKIDIAVIVGAFALCIAAFLIPGWPETGVLPEATPEP